MSFDWISLEKAERLYRIDGDRFASLVETGAIDFIQETHKRGHIFKYAQHDVARAFPARDTTDGAAQKAGVFGAAAAATAAITEGISALVDAAQLDTGPAGAPLPSDPEDPQRGGAYVVVGLENFLNMSKITAASLADRLTLTEQDVLDAQRRVGGGSRGVTKFMATRINSYCNWFAEDRGWDAAHKTTISSSAVDVPRS
mmetsp:Transcript_23941/g.43613  ORF Transcript_23941/g.43613 Transcript_23941/m.43613 type:complete len:200 (+) Transcript_23941:124-723(+)